MYRYIIILLAGILIACNQEMSPEAKLFTLLNPEETGIDFENRLEETEAFNMIEYLYFNNGAGVAAGDINNDGWVDLYFTGSQISNRLYLNKDGLFFEDITRSAGVGGKGDWKTGVTMADVNGDGFLDIFVCQVSDYKGRQGGNQLFINNGDLTFSDKTESYGLQFKGFSTQSAFFDFDLDGDLDMFLLNHSVHSRRTYGKVELREEFDPKAGDRLYRNNLMEGSDSFTDVTDGSGIYSSQIGYGLNVSIGDLNDDGYPDIYISNDFHENDYLYINNRDGTFTDRFVEMMTCSSRSSMGNDIGDMNNDGLLDVVVLDMLPVEEKIRQRSGGEDPYDVFQIKRNYGYYYQFVRNTLQLNLGGGLFSEIGRFSGIYATDWSWSPLWCDLDNDGWKDLFISNGIYRRPNDLDYIQFLTRQQNGSPSTVLSDRELYEKMPLDKLVNYAFKNNRDLTFINQSEIWGFDRASFSNGTAYADLDNDGDLDLVVNNINEPAFIYRNNSREQLKRNFLNFRFSGNSGNTKGIGARITLYDQGQVQLAENYTTRGFYSSVPPELHFGLDTVMTVDSIRIHWPGKGDQVIKQVASNQVLEIDENSMQVREISGKKNQKKLFQRKELPWARELNHHENRFSDYQFEKLMPHLLSTEGPCIAVGDVNRDQREDLYFGGSGEQPGKLLMQDERGGFTRVQEEIFAGDLFYEDVDAEFFDADGDGDLDLYVVSGGNEYILPSPFMKDRLYINNGRGQLTRSNDRIPVIYHNGACVTPCDYDQDGDLDLFVGSRSIPRAYGLPPISTLLINDGQGRFTDKTSRLAPDLMELGMVTDAVWTDTDSDGDQDLVVVGEWMPVTIMTNIGGILNKQPGDSLKGWWFAIQAVDIDQDGDEDLIAGNLGLNSYIKPTPEFPVRLYINDFDGNGQLDQILTYYQNGIEYPFAPADELFRQMPALGSKFDHYADFAGRSLQELFPEEILQRSIIEEATCFESSIFLNSGTGSYQRIPFPVEIQFSAVMDFLVEDLDRDNQLEILIAGNYYPVIPYLGRMDASYGWMIDVQGRDQLAVVLPVKSGFEVHGEVRDLEMVEAGDTRLVIAGLNNREADIFYVQHEN